MITEQSLEGFLVRFAFPLRFVILLAALAAFGCNKQPPIDPGVLAALTAGQARVVVANAGGGIGYAGADDSTLGKMSRGLSGASQGLAKVPLGQSKSMAIRGNAIVRAFLGPATLRAGDPAAGGTSGKTLEQTFDDTAADLEVLLRDRILVAANLESKTDDEATYLLHPDPTCRGLPSSGATEVDPSCADDLTKLPVRAVMTRDGDGARFSIQLGAERAELFALVVHSNLLALEVDLAKAKHATDIANTALGGSSPSDAFKALAGRVRVSLSKDGDKRFTAGFWVLDMIDIETKDAGGAPTGAFRTAARGEPVVAVTADGVAKTLGLTANLGTTEVQGAWDPDGKGLVNDDLLVVLGGLTGKTTVSDAAEEAVFTGLGLGEGTTSVKVRGQTIFAADLNPSDGRKFDLKVTLTPAGEARFAVVPSFDLALAYAYKAIAADSATPPPAGLLDETYRFLLGGGGGPVVETVAANMAKGFGGGLKLATGMLTLSAKNAGASLTVPEGKCLTSTDMVPMGSQPVIGAFSVVDCP